MHVSDCDSDSEFTNEQRATYLNNLAIERENLIKKFLKNHDILKAQTAKIELMKK